jgi:hypothetical protein
MAGPGGHDDGVKPARLELPALSMVDYAGRGNGTRSGGSRFGA